MSPRRFSGVTVVIVRSAAMHPMIHGIGIGEAMQGVAAMAKGQDSGRGHKAKGSENGHHHCRAEAKPGAEYPHYALSVVGRRRCDKPHR
jgi:hypothetical protein